MEHQTRIISKYVMLKLLLLCYFDVEQVLSSPIQSETVCRTDGGDYKGTYNSETQECCNGEIENKRDGLICCNGEFNLKKSEWRCCNTRTGQELFNPADSVCCNGNVYDKESGMCLQNYMHCDGHSEEVWVDSLTQTYCYDDDYCGTLVEGVGQCCGSDKIFNNKTEQCCRGDGNFSTVTPFDEQIVALGHQSHYSCCGTGSTMRSYNTLDEVCCNGIVHPRTPFHKCCASQYIDGRTHLCCDDLSDSTVASSFLIQDGRTECCVSRRKMTPYNPMTESCYRGKVTTDFGYGEKCRTKGVYNPTTSSCCKQGSGKLFTNIPTVPHIQDCCDGEAYLKSEKICCSNTLYDWTAASQMCCGIGAPINTDTHFCLDDTPTLTNHNICGSESYNTLYQTCCGGRLFDVANAQCCEESGAYDPATQTCCRGTGVWPNNEKQQRSAIHDGGDQVGKCCGEQLLQDNKLCVKESGFTVIVDISENPDHNSWCYGGNEYHPEESRIFTFDSSKKACNSNGYLTSLYEGEKVCGGRTTRQICCGGFIRAKVKNGAEQKCCRIGTESYNPATQQCDGGVVSELEASMCSGKEYDPQTEVCALGNCVRDKVQVERYPEFCGDDASGCFDETRWYNPAETSCCAGKLLKPGQICCRGPQAWAVQNIPNPELGDGLCCGGKAYNDHTHLCCGETAHNITNHKVLQCCGNGTQTFDSNDTSVICCGDNLWRTNGADMVCTGGVAHSPLTDGQTLCGNLVMDVTSHLCCDNSIYLKSEGSHCCGNLLYNPEDPSQLCCMGSRHLNAEGKQCCRKTAINPNITTCCVQGGVEYDYPKADVARYFCSDGSYDDTQHTCCEGVLHHGIVDGQCCGTEIVRNLNADICCGGRLQTKEHRNTICCGGVRQDGDKFTCCGDESVNQLNSYEKCCNGVKYYTYASICENGSLRPLHTTPASPTTLPTTNPSPTTEIITSEVIQTLTTEIITSEVIQTVTTEIITSEIIQTVTAVVTSELVPTTDLVPPLPVTAPSCGGTSYNQTTSICCDEEILPRFEGFRNCCSDVIYDTRTRICSKNGKIQRIRKGMTCGINYGEGELTHCNSFVCCNNTFHRIRKERNQCCGNDTFNPTKQECCGGVVINSKQSRCCDGSTYEVGKEVCCKGVLYELNGRVPAHCCPPGRYLHVKSGRCFRKDCMTCNQKHHANFWKKKVCEKRYLLSASITSYERKKGRFIFKASRITELDSNTAQWQDEMKDISIVIERGCKCQWLTRLLDGMNEEGHPKKEFLIMTDQEVIKGKKWVLADDDLIMEANGKAFKVKMRCKRDMSSG